MIKPDDCKKSGRPPRNTDVLNKQKLIDLYNQLKTVSAVAKQLGVDSRTVMKHMAYYNLPFKTGNRKYELNHNFFSEETEASFYMAGFIAADGCIKDKQFSKILEIRLGMKDTQHLRMLNNLLQSEYPLHHWESIKDNKISDGYCMQISSNKLCSDLLSNFNIGSRKSLTYTITQNIINHPLIHHFIRGYIDGDGSFYHSGRNINKIILKIVGSKELMENIRSIFIENCQLENNDKYVYPQGKIYRFQYSGPMLENIINYIYKDATIFLNRKKEICKYFVI